MLRTTVRWPKRTVSQIAIPSATGIQVAIRFSTWSGLESLSGSAFASPPATSPMTAATRIPSITILTGLTGRRSRAARPRPRRRRRRCGARATVSWIAVVPASSSSSRPMQPPDVVAPAPVTELERVAPGERPHVGRQVIAVGHPRSRDEHRDHGHVVAAQGGADLEPDEVLGVGDPNPAVLVGDRGPARPHDDDQHVAGRDRIRDPFDEVDPGREVDVHEHVGVAELGGHRVVEAPGVGGRSPRAGS